MRPSENDKRLDETIANAVGSNASKPKFDQWQQNHREAIKSLKSHTGQTDGLSYARAHSIWSNIMKNRITKYAAAAAIVVAVLAGVYHVTGSMDGANTAWAIEQTIEAMEGVRLVHFSGEATSKDGATYRFDLWATPNEDGTESENVRFVVRYQEHEQIVIVYENTSYEYLSRPNIVYVRPGKQIVVNPWVGSKFFQTLKESAADWNVIYGKDQETGRDSVFVTCSYEPMFRSWWFQFDRKTKVLVRFKQWHNPHREGPPEFDASSIVYNEDVRDDLFRFEIPEGAKVVKRSLLDDPDYGMSAEGLTKEEACIQICTKYWEAVIKPNWGFVHQLRPLHTMEESKALYGNNPPVKLMGIGQPYQQPGCDLGLVTPCRLKFKDGEIYEVRMVIKFREIDGTSSCIIAGTWSRDN